MTFGLTSAALAGVSLFPFEQYWWFYLAFTGAVLLLLVMDLGLFHRKAHTVTFSEAGKLVFFWVGLALLICYGLYNYSQNDFANDPRLMAIAGFSPAEAARPVAGSRLLRHPPQYQHRVLFYGSPSSISVCDVTTSRK